MSLVPPPGCPFHPRCFAKVGKICEEEESPLVLVAAGRRVACHLYSLLKIGS